MKKLLTNVLLFAINLRLFDTVPNKTTDTTATTGNDMSVEMKTFYSDYLIDTAKPKLVHDQFGQRHPIPKNGGKTIEFRVKHPFPKLLTPLAEGVTPTGQKLEWTKLEETVEQYGGFVELSDMLMMTAIDNNLVYATENCGDQAGETLDTVTREVLNGGTSVQFAEDQVAARHLLVGGSATPANNHYLSVLAVKRAVRTLKVMKAKPINGSWVAIIHPDIAFDLTNDSKWEAVKTYDPKDLYEGEIGRIHGCRFVETTEAKIFETANLTAAARNLTVASIGSAGTAKVITVDEAITAGEATALAGRKIIINGVLYTIASSANGVAGAATITITESPSATVPPADGNVMYPGEAGAAGRSVYSTLFLGADAYGVTEIEGGGMESIIKQLGSAGTADPLNQRASSGWKATKTAKRLVEAFMVRVETASTFESDAT